MSDLINDLKANIVESLKIEGMAPEQIDENAPLFGSGLDLDSIDALELVVSLEKKFGVTVPNSETAKTALATVNSIHDYVLANRKTA